MLATVYLLIIFVFCQLSKSDGLFVTSFEQTSAPTNESWTAVASSASGQQIVASSLNGSVYISSNYGYTWINSSVPLLMWNGIASSSSGKYLYIVSKSGQIYSSNNYGVDWTLSLASTVEWYCICTSSSGKYAFVAAFGAMIAYSNNYGLSWLNSSIQYNSFTSVSCSASGQYVAVAAKESYIYVSDNFGVDFNKSESTVENWLGIVSNSSGQFLAAIAPHGNIFTSSDYGVHWVATDAPYIDWKAISMSGSGQYLYAVAAEHPMYYSVDFGINWVPSDSMSLDWNGIATSDSGQYIYALAKYDGIFANFYAPTSQPSSSPSVIPSVMPSSIPSGVPTIYSLYSYVLIERYSEDLDYFSAAMSSEGQFVYVGAAISGLLWSLDYGNSWMQNEDISASAVACSNNGSLVYAGGYYVYRSTNYASTWELTDAPPGSYHGIATSGSGQYVYVVGATAVLYSHSYGVNWTSSVAVNSTLYGFTGLDCSKSGQYVTVVSFSGAVLISNNYGINFTLSFTGVYESYAVALSADGQYQVVASQNADTTKGSIWRSTDYGQTWTITSTPSGNWICVAMSASGEYVFAGLFDAYMYFSADYGINWSKIDDSYGDWYALAVSADAQFLAAVSFDQGIYTNEYRIPSSLPTSQPSPSADKPHSSSPSSQPSSQPSAWPTKQPSSYPTYIPDSVVETVQVLTSTATSTHVFNNLGCDSQVFLWVTILVSYLDADSLGAVSVVAGTGEAAIEVSANCAPQTLCGSVQCVANFNVTSALSCSGGGSLTLYSTTVNVDQFTGVDTRCTYNGTSGLQYALLYSLSAFPLPTASPTAAPTLQGGDTFVFEASPDTPFYIIVLVTLLFVFLGVFIIRVRDRNQADAQFSDMKLMSACVDLAWIGYHLSSEVFYVIVVYTEEYHYLAFAVVVIRAFSLLPGCYFVLSIFGPPSLSEVYDSRLNKAHLFKYASLYSLITVLMNAEQTMVRYLPWKDCQYTRVSRGFPDQHILSVCMVTKIAQLLCTLAVQLTVLIKSNIRQNSSKVALALVLMYLVSSVGNIVLFVVTNGIRFRLGAKSESSNNERLKSDEAVVNVMNPISGVKAQMTQLVRLSHNQRADGDISEKELQLAEQQTMKSEIVELRSKLADLEILVRRQEQHNSMCKA